MLRRIPATPALSFLVITGTMACGGDSFRPGALTDQDALYWRLELNHPAVLLSMTAPYDTLTLAAVPRNYQGEALQGRPAAKFVSEDGSKVVVTPDGVVRAIAPMPPGTMVRITASLATANVKHTDTAFVRVAAGDPGPMLDRLSIQPLPPDSAKVAVSLAFYDSHITDTIIVRATDVNGAPIAPITGEPEGMLPIRFSSSDPAVLRIGSPYNAFPEVFGFQVGTAMVYATATAFGITRADTLEYRVGWPLLAYLQMYTPGMNGDFGEMASENVFLLPELHLGVGGVAVWGTTVDTSLVADVTFDPAGLPNIASVTPWPTYLPSFLGFVYCGGFFWVADCVNSGDFPIGPNQRFGARRFTAPGIYEYRSTRHPKSRGRIIVVDER